MKMNESQKWQYEYFMDHIQYGALYIYSFSILEYFLYSFFIEKLNLDSVKTKDDLDNFLINKYGFDEINFLRLTYANQYKAGH